MEGAKLWSLAEVQSIDVKFRLGSGVKQTLSVELNEDGEPGARRFQSGWELLSSERAVLLTDDELTERSQL